MSETQAAAMPIAPPPRAHSPTFFGEPRALAYLAFTEAWERFSYYGMTALLVLYMSQALFTPQHIGHIAGFAAFRAGLEAVFGRMSTLAFASQVYGLYTGFVYFTPLFGGLVADRLIGRRNAVMLGAILMSAGHVAMAFDASFLLALALLITGCGLLKGNISTQVGELYPEEDAGGRTRGFAIFSMAINVGAVAGPLACGLLAQIYDWHAGFALAGVLMLLGLATYVAGFRHLSDPDRKPRAPAAPAEQGQLRIVLALFVVMAITVFQSIAFYQNSDVGLLWIDQHVDRTLLGFALPQAWFVAINSFVSIVAVPPLFALWRWQARHGGEPDEMQKIAMGAWITVAANLVQAAGSLAGSHLSVLYPVLYNVLLGIGFLYYWPTLLALVSGAAPPRIRATMMGCVFLTLFLSNITIGRVGALYENLGPAKFWALNAAIAAAGGLLAFLLGRPLRRILASHA
ncbi:MAG TPA: peptide MFS transporter [Rhizomicrobium sp.]|nr:peptide MFS transporter [Rhizomicrobium sp.]